MPPYAPEDVMRLLTEQGNIPAASVADVEAKVASGVALYDAVVGDGLVNGEAFTQAEATVMQLPYVDLHGLTIPSETLRIIPESTARGHSIIAYEKTEAECRVAMRDPSDRQMVEFIQKKVDLPVTVALASRESIQIALAQYQKSLDYELEEILSNVGTLSVMEGQDLSKVAEELPTIRMMDLILKHAILQGASDIHIEPTEKNVVVRYRVDGILHDMLTLPRNYIAGLIARIKVLGNLKIDEHRLPQDGRFKIETEDYKVAFRVSILPVFDGEKVVMRLLDETGKGLSLEAIGMRTTVLEAFRRNIQKPHGMVLVTGPTGSGKTTTLYAAMKELNTPEVNISTIEDPIEYRMTRINQTQVNPQIGMTFSNGLRALVRQDPDVLMVGEIRDEETASLAVNAALTGHLVLSTLHTNSAAGALPRLLDMKVEAFLLGSTVNLLVAQRLVRHLCKECKQKDVLGADIISDLQKLFDTEQLTATLVREKVLPADTPLSELVVYKPAGCKLCNAGYKGRAGIYEALEFTDEIREMITSKTSSQELEEAGRKKANLVLMIEDGFLKIAEGVTSVEEVLRVAKS
jgi:type IV pilus assembly protein PilB